MSAAVPGWLRGQIRAHNVHAVGLVILATLSAVLVWVLAYFVFMLLLMGFLTTVRGAEGDPLPAWLPLVALGTAVGLFLWGMIDHLRRRFQGVPERSIIGWHLVGDFFLLPVRLTFAIWGNLSAILWLSDGERERIWDLLATIQRSGKTHLSALLLVEPDPDRLYRLVNALQLLGLIDLHRGEGDWYYSVPSSHRQELGQLLGAPEQQD